MEKEGKSCGWTSAILGLKFFVIHRTELEHCPFGEWWGAEPQCKTKGIEKDFGFSLLGWG